MNILKNNDLYILDGWIAQYVNYNSVQTLKNKWEINVLVPKAHTVLMYFIYFNRTFPKIRMEPNK